MSATISKGYTFGATELVTNTKLHSLVDSATISGIANSELDKITTAGQVSGSALTGLASIPSGAGVIPAANLTSVAQKGANTDITSLALTGSINPTNLIFNGNFEYWSTGASEAPDGWALEETPTVARDTGDVGYGSYSVKITGAGAALEGIKFTTGTLKPSTKYTLSVRVKVTAGDTASIKTTGATTNLDLESTSETFETKTGTFTTDGSGTAVVIKLLAKADTDIVWFDGAICVEGESAFAFSPKPAEEGVWADYSATSTIVGWSEFTEKKIYTKKIGKLVFVAVSLIGTSDSTAVTLTLPYTSANTTVPFPFYVEGRDNGTDAAMIGRLPPNSATVTCYKTGAFGAFTNSGGKITRFQFCYESA